MKHITDEELNRWLADASGEGCQSWCAQAVPRLVVALREARKPVAAPAAAGRPWEAPVVIDGSTYTLDEVRNYLNMRSANPYLEAALAMLDAKADALAATPGAPAALEAGGANKPHYRIDWPLLTKAQDAAQHAFEQMKRLNTPESLKALDEATKYRDSWAGHYLCRFLSNYAPAAPVSPVAAAPEAAATMEGSPSNG
ncbi:hypothetical protein [Hymenobacter properus]|uniref:Uncharacterized protein n=1 Tax=Hymenobacter properus TaxID=2791026 RepID=A0A931BFP3_9BACT|nr:hypothetical protein [Hymenobacter properus]MBF9140816.1 hypothetical protein [Hymenobacter properus]MBR7719625.1 hypothetical protein [Microvirga sp. SRT04]